MDTSSSLDSIWDKPAILSSPKRVEPLHDSDDEETNTQRPAKRSRQTLFLADSDDDEFSSTTRVTHKAPPAQDVDVDALFAGIDDDELLNFQRVPDRVNEDELARQAEADARRRAPPLTPHQIMPSSSPVKDTDNRAGGKKSNGKKSGDDDEKKSRRRLVKLDENRLLGPSGFPHLISMTKDFRIKGKGHEATDLNRLLQKYQYWTHQLYPKTNFRDTVERVEKLCHSRRMNVSLSVWRDEAHGKPTKQPEDSDEDDNDNRGVGRADQADDERMDTDDRNPGPRSSPSRSSSRVSSPPASGPSSEGDMPIQPLAQNADALPESSNREEDEQEDFWRSLDEFSGDVSDPPPAPTTAPNSSMDEDEEMWDIINEVEQEAATKRSLPADGTNTSMTQTVGNPPDDDDYDDMYV